MLKSVSKSNLRAPFMNLLEQALCKRFDTFFKGETHLNLMLKPVRIWKAPKGKTYALFNMQGYFLRLPEHFVGNPNNPDHTLRQLRNLSPCVGLFQQMVIPLNEKGLPDYAEQDDVGEFLENRVFFVPNRTVLYIQQFHKKSNSFHAPQLSPDNQETLMKTLSEWFAGKLDKGVGREILMQAALILVGRDFVSGFQKTLKLLPKAADMRSFLDSGLDHDPSFDEYVGMFEQYIQREV